MTQRDLNSIAQKLGDFMTTHPGCSQAARNLGKKVEIGILIDNELSCAFFKTNEGGAGFEVRAANNPDIIFRLSSNAVQVLCSQEQKNLGELGVEVLKLYVKQEVGIQVLGSFLGIMKNGYLGIIKDAGMPFAKFLAEHGVSNLSKIPEIIKKLKNHR